MSQAVPPTLPTQPGGESSQADSAQVLKLTRTFKGGATWFFWVAALSLINAVLNLTQANMRFLAGLGITEIVSGVGNGLTSNLGNSAAIVTFAFNLIVAGIVVVFGIISLKRYLSVFIIGTVLYAIDGLIFLPFGDFVGFGFHVFVLIWLIMGIVALAKLNKIMAASPSAPASTAAPAKPGSEWQ